MVAGGSIHTAAWPTPDEVAVDGDALLLDDLATALAAVRGAKSQAKVSMRTEVSRAEFTGAADVLDRLKEIEADLRAVGRLTGEIQWSAADVPLTIDVRAGPDRLRPSDPATWPSPARGMMTVEVLEALEDRRTVNEELSA